MDADAGAVGAVQGDDGARDEGDVGGERRRTGQHLREWKSGGDYTSESI